ncbi:MAG: hypothetical protein J6H31_15075 [Butyrivibrio sp.]|nr:hypothetical protein [Butyrivibrio sp.]
MAMVLTHNNAAMQALHENQKNSNKLSKDLKKVASGMKINGAGDSAAEYAISEKMRTKIRGLDQDIQNVQNGRALLSVADGGIQSIIDELRSLKELAINSANDHNSSIDRATLQEEFNQRRANIEEIAVETNYNGIPLLDGRWCQLLWDEGQSNPKIISQNVSTNTTTGDVSTTVIGPNVSVSTLPSTKKTVNSSTTIIASSPPATTGMTTVGPVTGTPVVTSVTTTTGPTVASSSTTTSNSSITKNGNQTTVTDTDVTITNNTATTVTTVTDTTKVQKVTTTTFVTCNEITSTKPEEPILITNGTTSITANGVYRFASDYTGTLTISAPTVEIMGPEDGSTVNDVYIVDNGLQDLYLKDVNISNNGDDSTIRFDSAGSNTLHLLGTNTIYEEGNYPGYSNPRPKNTACINAGGNLSVVGNGSLSITSKFLNMGAIIGSDWEGSCGNVSLGQGITIDIVQGNNGEGAGIGSGGGESSSCGDITIGSNSNITVKRYTTPGGTVDNDNPGVAIGAGDMIYRPQVNVNIPPKCGNITIYSNANVTAYGQKGAGIGCGAGASSCGNITIYSDAKVDAKSQSVIGSAAIGSGTGGYDTLRPEIRYKSTCGDIKIYSYSSGYVKAVATSLDAQAIGKGNTSSNYSAYSIVGTVSLLDTVMQKTGGIADYSELSLGETTVTEYEIITDTIETTETTGTITETVTTQYDTWTETTEHISTTVYEDGEYERIAKLNNPLIIHTGTKANEHLRVYIENMRISALGIEDTKIDPLEAAVSALGVIDEAIEYALNNATKVGAYSSRLGHTNETLVVSKESTTASESTIRDADMAKEMMSFTKNSILTQASQAILAQANQNLSNVLSLLQ